MTGLLRPAPYIEPPGTLRYLVLYGSHAHGTATATSDEDWRGVYQMPNDAFLGLARMAGQKAWERKPDIVCWELGQFARMLLAGNPNIVGLLSAPDDCIAKTSPVIEELRAIRSRFVSAAMASAYIGWIESELRHAPETVSAKRLSHIPRLYWEMTGATETGDVPVRLEGEQLEYIRAVKRGEVTRSDVETFIAAYLPALKAASADLPAAPWATVQDIVLRARHGSL